MVSPSAKMRKKLQFISLLSAVPQCCCEDLSSVITRFHWTLLTVSTRQFSWGLQKPLGDLFDHEACRGCALGPHWGLSAGVPCAPAPKVRIPDMEKLEKTGGYAEIERSHSSRRCVVSHCSAANPVQAGESRLPCTRGVRNPMKISDIGFLKTEPNRPQNSKTENSVRQRIQYKLASLAFRALSGLAPDYLAGDCQLVADSGRRSLRSAERRICYVPRQNSTFGDWSFTAAGPRTWNELPSNIRDTGLSLTTFNEHLKTYLFSTACWDHGAFVTFMISLRHI